MFVCNIICGKILEAENFGESLMKQMVWKILANLLAGLLLFTRIVKKLKFRMK